MELLENLQRNQLGGQIWWCYHEPDGEPSERVQALISKHKGALIPIAGFDEFMLQLNETLKLQLLDNEIEQRGKERGEHYRMQVADLMKNITISATKGATQEVNTQVRQALTKTIERQKGWWSWELKAQEEPNMALQEKIYQDGLQEFPESHELMGCYDTISKERNERI